MADHLDRLTVQRILPFRRLLQIIAPRPWEMFTPSVKMQVTAVHPDAGSLRLGFFNAPLNITWKAIKPIDASRVHKSPL
jgi:hypothetical protein